MPSNTPNYNLKEYDRVSDTSQLFIDFRDDLAGTGSSSNMSIIDQAMADNANAILAIKGAGYTSETLVDNALAIASLKQKGVYTASVSGTNSLTATVLDLTTVPNNAIIKLKPSVANTSTVTLSINSETALPVVKVRNISGSTVYTALEAGDLQPNSQVFITKSSDGVRYLLVNFGEDYARNVFYDNGDSSFTSVQEKITNLDNEISSLLTGVITIDKDALSQTVTDSYVGTAKIKKAGGATTTNILANGGVDSSIAVAGGNNYIGILPNGNIQINNAYNALEQTFDIVSGRKYALLFVTKSGKILDSLHLFYSDASIQSDGAGTTLVNKHVSIITANKTLKANLKANVGTYSGTLNKDYCMVIPITGTVYESFSVTQLSNIVGEYFEGQKSASKTTLLSRATNSFDGYNVIEKPDYYNFNGIELKAFANRAFLSGTRIEVQVKKNTDYKLKFNRLALGGGATQFYVGLYDGFLNGITSVNSGATGFYEMSGNSGLSDKLIIEFSRNGGSNDKIGYALYNQIQVNEGTTALPYETYKGVATTIECTNRELFELSKVFGGTENTIETDDSGLLLARKNNNFYALQSADITSYDNTTFVDVDLVRISRSSLVGFIPLTSTSILGAQIGSFISEYLTTVTATDIGKATDGLSPTVIDLIVAKGAYIDVADARTKLAGYDSNGNPITGIAYRLLNPEVKYENDFADWGITVDGALKSLDGYMETISYDFDLLGDSEIEYPLNNITSNKLLSEQLSNTTMLAQKFINDSVWINYIPTLTFTGTPPASIATVARYQKLGNIVNCNLYLSSADGNGATNLRISLPITPKDNNAIIAVNAQEKVNTTWTNPLGYIDDDAGLGIQFRNFATATDAVAWELICTFSYEV